MIKNKNQYIGFLVAFGLTFLLINLFTANSAGGEKVNEPGLPVPKKPSSEFRELSDCGEWGEWSQCHEVIPVYSAGLNLPNPPRYEQVRTRTCNAGNVRIFDGDRRECIVD